MREGEFKNLLKVSAPAYMHFPRSFLECNANDQSFYPTMMLLAAKTSDPVQRIKFITACYVGMKFSTYVNRSLAH